MEESSLTSFLIWTVFFLVAAAAVYVYFAVTLMLIARKTNTPGAGLAWIPVANLVLMCRVARRPAWWVLLLFIPLVGLAVFAMLWMGIAEMRGKPAWLGAATIVPLIGWVIPAYLALGDVSDAPAFAAGERNCHACGSRIFPDETFCRDCGEEAATLVAAGRKEGEPAFRASGGRMILVGGIAAVGVVLIFGIFGWLALNSIFAYGAPDRRPPALPERTGGTLTEFPVDTDEEEPLVPDLVATEDLEDPPDAEISDGSEKRLKKRLPPGIDRGELKKRGGENLTTTVYRPRRTENGPPGDEQDIYISVVRIPAGSADPIAVRIAGQTRGRRTGTRVRSPRGETYVGSKISSPGTLIYVLEKQNSNILILIYTPNPAMEPAAARLAGNVGNGEGLNDYPETRATLWTLPPDPPSDLVLIGLETTTRDEMGLSEDDIDAARTDRETSRLIDYFSQFIPERAIEARYLDTARRENWKAGIFDYQSSGRAWRTWLLLSWTLGLSGETVSLRHGSGLLLDTDEGRMLLFQKGPYLIFIQPPAAAGNNDRLIRFADGFQV